MRNNCDGKLGLPLPEMQFPILTKKTKETFILQTSAAVPQIRFKYCVIHFSRQKKKNTQKTELKLLTQKKKKKNYIRARTVDQGHFKHFCHYFHK